MKTLYAFLDKYYAGSQQGRRLGDLRLRRRADLVQVLKQCGDDLTRENVMKQAASLKDFEPAACCRASRSTPSATDFAPISQLQLMRFKGETWELFGEIISGRRRRLISRRQSAATQRRSPRGNFAQGLLLSSADGANGDSLRRRAQEPRPSGRTSIEQQEERDWNACNRDILAIASAAIAVLACTPAAPRSRRRNTTPAPAIPRSRSATSCPTADRLPPTA